MRCILACGVRGASSQSLLAVGLRWERHHGVVQEICLPSGSPEAKKMGWRGRAGEHVYFQRHPSDFLQLGPAPDSHAAGNSPTGGSILKVSFAPRSNTSQVPELTSDDQQSKL